VFCQSTTITRVVDDIEGERESEEEEEEDEHDSAIIERLGITFDTLKSFQAHDIEIDQDKVEETYPVNPKKPRFTVDGRPASGKPGKSVIAPIRRMAELYRQNPVKYARYEYICDNEDYLCGVEDDNGNEVQPAKRIDSGAKMIICCSAGVFRSNETMDSALSLSLNLLYGT
jgi:hypothetical protein